VKVSYCLASGGWGDDMEGNGKELVACGAEKSCEASSSLFGSSVAVL